MKKNKSFAETQLSNEAYSVYDDEDIEKEEVEDEENENESSYEIPNKKN